MRLYYKKLGSGRPMVILHGLYGSSDNWLSIAKLFSESFEIYLVDLRNHGKSPHDDKHNYELMRDDLIGFLDERGLDKVVLVGHSMGGKVAMCFAQHNPGRVDHLVVVDIAPKSYKELYRQESLNHSDILMAMKSIDLKEAASRRDIDRMLSEKVKPLRVRRFLMKNLERNHDGVYRWTLNLDVLIRELDNIMDGVNRNCFDPVFPVTGIPVLFVRGDNSPYIQDEDMDFIDTIFPSAGLITIPDAGHWLHAEKPEAFAKAVKEFVSG